MRWITDKKEFDELNHCAWYCTYVDSGRSKTDLVRLKFDDARLLSEEFGLLLKNLMKWSNLNKIYFSVLDPDPEYYFHDKYGVYPYVEVEQDDLPEKFLKALNTPYDAQPTAVLGLVNMGYVISCPPTMPWFIHALRSTDEEGGHLWVPKGWPDKIFKFDKCFVEAEGL